MMPMTTTQTTKLTTTKRSREKSGAQNRFVEVLEVRKSVKTFRGRQRDGGEVEERLASVRVMAVELIEVAIVAESKRYLGW